LVALAKRRRMTWHSKITFLKPHEYVDEMAHSKNGGETEIIDEIEFELPYGILEKLFEGYAYKQLQNTFEHRKIATVKTLENN
jgi:ligand-binding SRPBCC domain-containing protein